MDIHSVDIHSVNIHSVEIHSVDIHSVDIHSVDIRSILELSYKQLDKLESNTIAKRSTKALLRCRICTPAVSQMMMMMTM